MRQVINMHNVSTKFGWRVQQFKHTSMSGSDNVLIVGSSKSVRFTLAQVLPLRSLKRRFSVYDNQWPGCCYHWGVLLNWREAREILKMELQDKREMIVVEVKCCKPKWRQTSTFVWPCINISINGSSFHHQTCHWNHIWSPYTVDKSM